MAIEKGLYAAPAGLVDDTMDMELLLSGEGPMGASTIIELDDGGVEITLGEVEEEGVDDAPFEANLAEYMDEGALQTLSSELMESIESDISARRDWADTYVKGLDVLGFKYEERTEPWENACGAYSNILAEAAIRFQAEAMSETFPASGPVKTKILGDVTSEKEDAALRVKDDMNYELTEVMSEYRPEHERMLYSLGLAGSAFKKVYYDPARGRQVSLYIPGEDVVVPYGESNIEAAERVTHIMRKTKNEVKKLQASGFYRDVDLGEPVSFFTDIEEAKAEQAGYTLTSDSRYSFFEIHADLVIEGVDEEESEESEDEDGEKEEAVQIAKPYVVTVEKGTGEVLAIRRNWDPEDPLMLKRQHFVHYVYVPGFGFYGLGLIHIIGGYARAGTSIIRQLVDAGTLSNLPGGLKTRGLRIKGDDTPIGPGDWKDVDVPSGSIRDNIMALPYKEPSQTLLALLQQITEEGRRLGAISDMNISDMSANAPVGTTLALLERTLKPMAAVQSRVHFAMKQEFKLLRKIIAEYAPEEYSYVPERGTQRARKADYAMVDVIPVSDPNSSTMAQRVVQYQTALQMSAMAPQIYDLPLLHRQMIEVLGIKNADKIVPIDGDAKPVDPVSENMNAITGKPIKAFINQSHEAHIATHEAFLQDPTIMQTVGQNPMANQIMSSLRAHIAEHTAYLYRQQIEAKIGAPLPAPNEELPPEFEVQLAQLMSAAAIQLTQAHQQEAAQAQAQAQQQDPLIQMQQQELQIKGSEVQRKAQQDQAENAIAAAKLELDKQKSERTASIEASRIASQNEQAQAKNDLEEAKAILAAATTQQPAAR